MLLRMHLAKRKIKMMTPKKKIVIKMKNNQNNLQPRHPRKAKQKKKKILKRTPPLCLNIKKWKMQLPRKNKSVRRLKRKRNLLNRKRKMKSHRPRRKPRSSKRIKRRRRNSPWSMLIRKQKRWYRIWNHRRWRRVSRLWNPTIALTMHWTQLVKGWQRNNLLCKQLKAKA